MKNQWIRRLYEIQKIWVGNQDGRDNYSFVHFWPRVVFETLTCKEHFEVIEIQICETTIVVLVQMDIFVCVIC